MSFLLHKLVYVNSLWLSLHDGCSYEVFGREAQRSIDHSICLQESPGATSSGSVVEDAEKLKSSYEHMSQQFVAEGLDLVCSVKQTFATYVEC